MATRLSLDRLRFFELFDHQIAFARDHVAAQPSASHFADTLRDARFALHEDVQIVGIEHEQACCVSAVTVADLRARRSAATSPKK